MPKTLMTVFLLALVGCTDPDASDFAQGCDDAAASEDEAVECMRTRFVRAQDRLDDCVIVLGVRPEDVERQRELEREEEREERDEERERAREEEREQEREREARERDTRDVDPEEARREHERASRELRDARDRGEDDVRGRPERAKRRSALRRHLRRAWELSDCDRVSDSSRRR